MIKKDPGNPQIEHLRVIHLFKVDYNFCLKLLWGCCLVGVCPAPDGNYRKEVHSF